MDKPKEISFVIPVYNGSATIESVVEDIMKVVGDLSVEIILVNDGSADHSEQVCSSLADRFSGVVKFLHLAKNFGEHNAVLAGLSASSGRYAACLDDDGQNPPSEVMKLYREITSKNMDVVYGNYNIKKHHWFRNFGSWINDRMATVFLKKPSEIYLSSFKIMNRFIVNEIIKYTGAYPYIDGLIYRSTANIGQISVFHKGRESGGSNYTLRRLIHLWLNMFLGFSILPLRIASVAGLGLSFLSVFWIFLIVADKLWIQPEVPHGIPTVLATIIFFSGIQLLVVGLIGEYLGRLFFDHSKAPQFVIRYAKGTSDAR